MEDRVLKQWKEWQQREAAFTAKNINAKAALNDRHYLKLKHLRLAEIAKKYGKTKSPDEQVSLALLKANNKAIEKRLYPGRLNRYARRLFRYAARKITEGRKNILARRSVKLANRQPGYLLSSSVGPTKIVAMKSKAPTITRTPGRKIVPMPGVKPSKGIRK